MRFTGPLRINPKIVILSLIVLIITICMAIPAYIISNYHHNFVISELQKRAEGIAASIAIQLQHAAPSYKNLLVYDTAKELPPDDYEFYQKMNHSLSLTMAETHADYIYTEQWIDEATIAYILDGTDPAGDDFSSLKERDVMDTIERNAFLNQTTASTGLIDHHVWGTYITGWSPIVDPEDGSTIGLVGVDFSVNEVLNLKKRMDWIIGGSFFILILLLSIGIYFVFILAIRSTMEDFLTKLHTRKYLISRLKDELSLSGKGHKKFCFALIDVDWFKQVNDTIGHESGDRLLLAIANVIRSITRVTDVSARYGGDEFAILFTESTIKDALKVSSEILHSISKVDVIPGIIPSLSIGIVEWEPGMDEHTIIECADKALYDAKNEGKGVIRIYKRTEA
ncbi:MAG: GGDEF domain-containing protein [Sphaerochaetaceae bacterium]|nr:GGDEF domain-containing protein [Sphaerochaetaceae bacterium]